MKNYIPFDGLSVPTCMVSLVSTFENNIFTVNHHIMTYVLLCDHQLYLYSDHLKITYIHVEMYNKQLQVKT